MNLSVADGCTPIKRLKNVRQVRLVNSNPTVLNRDTDFSVAEVPGFFTERTNTDPAILTAILSRIHDQILQTARKRVEIAHHARQIGLDVLLNLETASRISAAVFSTNQLTMSESSRGCKM